MGKFLYEAGDITEVFGRGNIAHMGAEPGPRIYRLTLPGPLPGPLPGFKEFLTPWLILSEKGNIILDIGPRVTIGALVDTLRSAGIREVHLVLLTHVHIDHAGGVSDFVATFPEVKVLVHPKACTHLIDPTRLWQGSVQTLGELAYAYGGIGPVPVKNLTSDWSVAEEYGISVLDTPGHASHHQSYVYGYGGTKVLFAGEAAGVLNGPGYLRPATPPRFFFDIAYESIARLIATQPSLVCCGHFGYTDDPAYLVKAREQLVRWKEIIGSVVAAGFRDRNEDEDEMVRHAFRRLLEEDPCLRGFRTLPADIAARERYFIENSIRGFMGYLWQGHASSPSREGSGRDALA